MVGEYASLGIVTFEKDYAKQYMLCRECENYLGAAEGYLAAIVRGAPNDLLARRIGIELLPARRVRLTNVKLALVFRALFGVAFKIHLARSYPASRVRFPRAWEIELRNAILSDDYPTGRFGMFAYKVVNLTVEGANPKAYLGMRASRTGGIEELSLWMAGWTFYLSMGGSATREAGPGLPLVACEGTTLDTGVNEFAGELHVNRGLDLTEEVFDAAGLVGPTDPCPCGMDLEFGFCCSGRWLPLSSRYLETGNKPTRRLRGLVD